MCRLLIAGGRRAGLSHEACVRRCRDDLVPAVRRLPNLMRYTSSVASDPETEGYDLLQRLKFHGPEERAAALASEQWASVEAEMEKLFDRTEVIATEDQVLH